MGEEQLLDKHAVRAFHDGIAGFYQNRKKRFYMNMMKEQVQRLHCTSGTGVDLGCGTGLTTSWLATDTKVGLDLSPQLISHGQKKNMIVGDIEQLPLQPHSFDVVLLLDVLEHLPTFHVFDEINRIIKNTGVFLIAVANKKYEWLLDILEKLHMKLPEGPHVWRPSDEIEQQLSKRGFRWIKTSKYHMNFYQCTPRGS